SSLRTCVLLRARAPKEFVSMRITARLSPVLEAIEAGRTGTSRLDFSGGETDDERFDRAVSVYTREEQAARRLLGPPARQVLTRLLSVTGSDNESDDDIPDTVRRTPVAPVVIVGALDVLLILDD